MLIDPAPSNGWALIAADALGVKPNTVLGVAALTVREGRRGLPPQTHGSNHLTASEVLSIQNPDWSLVCD